MITKDRIKEEIGLNKLAITIFSAVEFSLISWIWKNNFIFDKENIVVYIVATSLLLILILICFNTTKKVKELDNYD